MGGDIARETKLCLAIVLGWIRIWPTHVFQRMHRPGYTDQDVGFGTGGGRP